MDEAPGSTKRGKRKTHHVNDETESGSPQKRLCINSLSIEEAFLQSVEQKDHKKIKAFLNLEVNVNATLNKNGFPVLFKACEDPFMLNLFLSRGKEININCTHLNTGETPLMWCSFFGLVDSARTLCDRTDIDVNKQNKKGQTAIMIAAISGHTDVVRILLSTPSIDLNIVDSEGKSIANHVVESNSPGAIKCLQLLSTRLNWNHKPDDCVSPIMYSWKNKKPEMLQTLMTVANVDLKVLQNNIVDNFFTDCLKKVPDLCRNILLPSCPICLERFSKNGHVFQCPAGHFICGNCRPHVFNCPKCRAGMLGRCFDFELFLQTLKI